MKTLLFPLICAAAMAFTSCNDDEPIDCAAQYPFKVTKFIEKGGGTTIRFVPEESKLYYNYHIYTDSMVSDITVMLKYKYKVKKIWKQQID